MASKDNHDPGWNDPPIFTYDKATAIQAAAASKKGISLNKRVAFPINSNVQSEQRNIKTDSPHGNDSSRPPLMTMPPPLSSTPQIRLQSKPQEDVQIGSKERLEKVLQNLQIETNCDEEIAKRIRVMEKMWSEGKLEDKVQCKVLELSEALAAGDADAADHIQKGLMVDYVSQCSTWMSGIRHLINRKKKSPDQ